MNTRVTKVVSVGTQNGMPIMRGVQIAQTADGSYYTTFSEGPLTDAYVQGQ